MSAAAALKIAVAAALNPEACCLGGMGRRIAAEVGELKGSSKLPMRNRRSRHISEHDVWEPCVFAWMVGSRPPQASPPSERSCEEDRSNEGVRSACESEQPSAERHGSRTLTPSIEHGA